MNYATEYEGKAKIGKVDIDTNRETLQCNMDIQSIPSIMIFKDGEVTQTTFVGMKSKDELVSCN